MATKPATAPAEPSQQIDAIVHAHLRSIFEHSLDGLLLGTPEGGIIMANPAACALLGLSEADIIARGRDGIVDTTYPGFIEGVKQYLRTGSHRDEIRMVHASGELIPVEMTSRGFVGGDGQQYVNVVMRDLRPERERERARFLSEQRFGRLVEQTSQVVWIATPNAMEVVAPGWEAFTGQSIEAAQNGGWFQMVHPDDAPVAAAAWQKMLEDGGTFNAEFRMRRADGEYRWVHSRAVPVHNERGELSEWLGIIEDIDAWRRAHDALEERERSLRAIFDITAQGLILQDANGQFVEANAAATEILGLDHDELLARTPLTGWQTIRTDGTEWPAEDRPAVIAQRTGKAVEAEVMGVWNPVDGDYRWVIIHARPVFRPGEDRPFQIIIGFTDVTALRSVTQEAMLAAERTHSVVEAVTDAITIVSADGVITYANAAAEQVLGLKASSVAGRTYHDTSWKISAVDGGPFPEEQLPFRLVQRTGRPVYDVRHAIEHPDGTRVVLSTNAAPLHDADGAFAGMVAASRDVTNSEREQQRLAHLAAVLASSPDAMLSTTAEGIITSWNEAAQTIYGYTADEIIGSSMRQLIPDDVLGESQAAYGRAARGEVVAVETLRIRKDGTVFPALVSVAPLRGKGGAVVGLAAIVHDVSARRAAEQKLRFQARLLDNVQEAVTAVGPDGRYTYINDRAQQLLGWVPDDVLGRHYREVVGHSFPAEVQLLMDRCFQGESWTGELLARDADGCDLPSLLALAPIHDDAGQVAGAIGLLSDLRRVRSLEEQLGHAQKMEAIGRLAGGVAHDFNNVLTAIQGHAQLALDDVTADGHVREDLHEILRSAERATTLTRHLLAFSRRQVLQPRVIEVADVVRGMDRMLRRLIGEDIEFTNDCAASVACVLVDPVQLEQVVLNLVMNARDAMPAGGSITLRTTLVEPHVIISVSDTGTGIPRDIQQRIFEPFFTTKAPGKGSGLGLSTAYGIVRQSGGFITVSSVEGDGAVFTVHLPRIDEPSQPHRLEPVISNASGGTETVLLVEDEPAVRRLAQRILSARGYRVIEAEDGIAALQVAGAHAGSIDVLVTDIVMPRMSGLELVSALRATRADLAVLLMSGYSEEVVQQRGRVPENSIFLGKPFSPADLAAGVRDALAIRAPGDR